MLNLLLSLLVAGSVSAHMNGSVRTANPWSVQDSLCSAPNAIIDSQVLYLKRLVTATDSLSEVFRGNISIVTVDSAQVVYENDTAKCSAIALAHANALASAGLPLALRKVSVVRVGATRYVVFDVFAPESRRYMATVYDSTFVPLKTYQF